MTSLSPNFGALQRRAFACGLLAGLAVPAHALTTVSGEDRYVHGANIGWIDGRPSTSDGARVAEHVCSGYLYSANLGWIHLGEGSPEDGRAYGNASAEDYGVNVSTSIYGVSELGALSGYAYGANVGWIVFDPAGAPRVDLDTGRLSGYAYSANVGWILLGEFALSLAVDSIAPAPDSDSDGLPDAWELGFYPTLNFFASTRDFDGDGATDGQEYLADSDPVDPADHFRVLDFFFNPGVGGGHDSATLRFTSRPSRRYRIEITTSLTGAWSDSALGLFAPDGGTFTTRAVETWENSPALFLRVRAERPLAP